MNNSKSFKSPNNVSSQYRSKKYESMDEAQFLEESLKFFRNIKDKFLKNEQSNAL